MITDSLLVTVLRLAGLSQAELARRTGLSTKHVSQLATQTVDLSPHVALLLERELGVPAVEWLRSDAEATIDRHRRKEAAR